jgi:hypothetical protein
MLTRIMVCRILTCQFSNLCKIFLPSLLCSHFLAYISQSLANGTRMNYLFNRIFCNVTDNANFLSLSESQSPRNSLIFYTWIPLRFNQKYTVCKGEVDSAISLINCIYSHRHATLLPKGSCASCHQQNGGAISGFEFVQDSLSFIYRSVTVNSSKIKAALPTISSN